MATTELKISTLRQTAEQFPEYAAITPLFEAVYGYIAGKEGQTGISFAVAEPVRTERLDNGFPMLSPLDITFDRSALVTFLTGAAKILKQNGNGADSMLDHIIESLENGALEPAPLVVAILERHRAPIDEAAARLDVPPPLLEYLFEIPLKTALEQFSATIAPEEVSGWHEALCPVCGARPAMAELSGEEGHRRLGCSACFFTWPFKRLKCPSCGCEDTEQLSYFTAGDGATRVDTCKACSRYIKTRDGRKSPDRPLEIEDLLTIHLDLLAAREGFERGK
jgi:FdhE protein